MSKTTHESDVRTRTARLRLAARGQPYFRSLSEGVHLGYRRPASEGRAGAWIGRRYTGSGYETIPLGKADDMLREPSDGKQVLTFDQACEAAKTWDRARALAEIEERANGPQTPSVGEAVSRYIRKRLARQGTAGRDAELRLNHHVMAAPLADIRLGALTTADLLAWREGLRCGGRKKTMIGKPLAPASLARTLSDLRAALTDARRVCDAAPNLGAAISAGLRAPEGADTARAAQVLTPEQTARIMAAAQALDPDVGLLIAVLAATGARFDQAARLLVTDLQPAARRIMLPVSRKGGGAKQSASIAWPLTDELIAALRVAAAGRDGSEPLLMRWHHRQTEGGTWERTERRAWPNSAHMARPWMLTLKAAGVPAKFVPYSLRHTSIVRLLQQGLPIRLVAASHDTSVAMIEKTYSRYIVDASEDALRGAALPFSTGANVLPLRRPG